MRHHTQREPALRHRTPAYSDARGRTTLYARLKQAMLGPKHASNLTHVTIPAMLLTTSCVCCIPCVTCVALRAAGNCAYCRPCVRWKAGPSGGVLSPTGGTSGLSKYCNWQHTFLHTAKHLRIGSYRIVSYRDILCDIVSYLSFFLMAVSCHHYHQVLLIHSRPERFITIICMYVCINQLWELLTRVSCIITVHNTAQHCSGEEREGPTDCSENVQTVAFNNMNLSSKQTTHGKISIQLPNCELRIAGSHHSCTLTCGRLQTVPQDISVSTLIPWHCHLTYKLYVVIFYTVWT